MPNPVTKPVRFLRTISTRIIAISDGQEETFRRLASLEGRIGAIESRIGDLSHSIETRHVEMWKLISDVNNSLPMTVAMSTTESLRHQTETIRSDIADTRQEIAGVLSKVVTKNE